MQVLHDAQQLRGKVHGQQLGRCLRQGCKTLSGDRVTNSQRLMHALDAKKALWCVMARSDQAGLMPRNPAACPPASEPGTHSPGPAGCLEAPAVPLAHWSAPPAAAERGL
jgi:hypothetical protein